MSLADVSEVVTVILFCMNILSLHYTHYHCHAVYVRNPLRRLCPMCLFFSNDNILAQTHIEYGNAMREITDCQENPVDDVGRSHRVVRI